MNELTTQQRETVFAFIEALTPWKADLATIQLLSDEHLFDVEEIGKHKLDRYRQAANFLDSLAQKRFQKEKYSKLSFDQRRQLHCYDRLSHFANVNFFQKLIRRYLNPQQEHLRVFVTDVFSTFFDLCPLTNSERKTIVAFTQNLIAWSSHQDAVGLFAEDWLSSSFCREDFKFSTYHLAVHWLDRLARNKNDVETFAQLSFDQRHELLTKETHAKDEHISILSADILTSFYEHPLAWEYLKEKAI